MTPPSPPRCRALLLDLDGTLVDSVSDIAGAMDATLIALGRAPLGRGGVRPLVGDGARALVERALRATGTVDPALLARTLVDFDARYTASPVVHTSLLPGAREVLALDLPKALVTNKPRRVTDRVLEGLGIAGAFDLVVAGGDAPLKPAPDGVRAALAALAVPPDAAWMIGDGPQDVLAGRAAGCFTIAVPGIAAREAVLAAGPDLALASLHELARLAAPFTASA